MKLCILLLTYERTDYALETLRSALDLLECPEPLSVHIADDGSSEAHRAALFELAGGYSRVQGISVTNSERRGYGANYNLALQTVHLFADIILPLEDDWRTLRPFSLMPLIEALQEEQFGCVRLGYIGFTQELRGKFVLSAGHRWLLLDPDSAEPHVWSGHPRLETRNWQRRVGPWHENPGLDPGTTEFLIAQRREAREGVVWPTDLVYPWGDLFAHIGTVQARTDQRVGVA